MKVERIDVVCIDVKNLDRAVQLFSELFEIKFERIPFEALSHTHAITENADRAYEEAPMKSLVSKNQVGLEIIETIPPLEKEGLRAINIKVTDLEQAKVEMKRKGIPLLAEWDIGGFKEAIYSPKALHGVRICLVQYTAPDMISAILGEKD